MKELDLLRKIKSASFATLDGGVPQSRVIDVMLIENDAIYFLTARGKAFYRQITENPNIAVSAMDAQFRAVRIVGKARKADPDYVNTIFAHNPSMNDVYPGDTRDILCAFCIPRGVGEILDLSKTPPKRSRFAFGGAKVVQSGYRITQRCIACGECMPECPESAISSGSIYEIDPQLCIECGRCAAYCAADAIEPALPLRME